MGVKKNLKEKASGHFSFVLLFFLLPFFTASSPLTSHPQRCVFITFNKMCFVYICAIFNVFFEKNVMILLSERKHGGIRKSSVSDCFVTNAAGVGSGRREQMSPKKDQLSSYSREDSFVKERKTSYRKEGKKLPFPVKKKGSFEKIS